VGEGHLLHRKALRVKSADFTKSGSLFQSFPKCQCRLCLALSSAHNVAGGAQPLQPVTLSN
ncbi:hypothetical protein, partial [Zestomonas thermotolerans]|uniref:hypothetical protein n=1 Tax=Zestomonas thermotolerans TaxID=157784 RepID=UPI001B7FBCD1